MAVQAWWQTGESLSPGADGAMSAVRTFEAITAVGDTAWDVKTYASAPKDGDAHPDNGYLLCQGGVSVRKGTGPTHWLAEARYEAENFDSDDGNPLSRAWRIDYDWQITREAVEFAYEGATDDQTVYICNAAGEPFDPPLEEDHYEPVVICSRNVSAATAAADILYNNSVNSDTVGSFTAQQLLMFVEEHPVYAGDTIAYYQETVRILIRDTDWGHQRRLINAGYRHKDGSGALTEGVDQYTLPMGRPRALAANGQSFLAPGAAVNFLTFRTKKLRAWSGFSLPSF